MEIQSLSIVVPGGCPNDCTFCCSKLNREKKCYRNQMENNHQFQDLYERDYLDCMEFASRNGCNTMMYTGDGEPLMNRTFMEMVTRLNNSLHNPFIWIELQTSGVFLTKRSKDNDGYENLRWLRNYIRVKTISLSLASIWDSRQNALYTRPKNEHAFVDIEKTCKAIKDYDFTLRLSLNMTDFYNDKSPEAIFERAAALGADQITFRVLYNISNPQTEAEKEIHDWIKQRSCDPAKIGEIKEYITNQHGIPLERLPFGATKYSVHDMSCVLDDDCMSSNTENIKNEVKYVILRPTAKIYTKWERPGSRLF